MVRLAAGRWEEIPCPNHDAARACRSESEVSRTTAADPEAAQPAPHPCARRRRACRCRVGARDDVPERLGRPDRSADRRAAVGAGHVDRRGGAAAGGSPRGDPRRPRHRSARLPGGEAGRVPGAHRLRADRARARRQGRERRGRLRAPGAAPRPGSRRRAALLQPARGGPRGRGGGRLPDRPRRRVRGSGPRREPAPARHRPPRRRRLDEQRRPRLDEPAQQARLEVQRRHRRRRRRGGLRRDHVRLRPLPDGRRSLGRGLPGQEEAVEERDHRRTSSSTRARGSSRSGRASPPPSSG